MRLGKSQAAVLQFARSRWWTAQEIGDALYDTNSQFAHHYLARHRAKQLDDRELAALRREWAQKIARGLVKRGLMISKSVGVPGAIRVSYIASDDTARDLPPST